MAHTGLNRAVTQTRSQREQLRSRIDLLILEVSGAASTLILSRRERADYGCVRIVVVAGIWPNRSTDDVSQENDEPYMTQVA